MSLDMKATLDEKRGGCDDVEHGLDTSWKDTRSFVLKLACLTRAGGRADIRGMVNTSIKVSKDYTITGFQNGDSKLWSLIQVNSSILLALDAEAFGRVFGMEFEGAPVEAKVSMEKVLEVRQLLGEKNHKSKEKVFVDSFESADLREYIRQRKEKLHLMEWNPRQITWSNAYYLKEEFFNDASFNWAESKVNRLKYMLGTGKLSRDLQVFLAEYIAAVAPSVYQACKGLKSVAGGKAAGRGGKGGKPAMGDNAGSKMPTAENSSVIGTPPRRMTRHSAKSNKPQVLHPGSAVDCEEEQTADACTADDTVSEFEETEPLIIKAPAVAAVLDVSEQEQQIKETEGILLKKARDETKDIVLQAFRLLENQLNLIKRHEDEMTKLKHVKMKYKRDRLEFEKEKHIFDKEKYFMTKTSDYQKRRT